ncbi:MAG TPA: hypothetical protein VMX97_02670 [Hyphomicrobiaceae bacterium]|nr:hypothetical protein [Hyphomicrobiaceae bacterium]
MTSSVAAPSESSEPESMNASVVRLIVATDFAPAPVTPPTPTTSVDGVAVLMSEE